jgi:hypothetical protein
MLELPREVLAGDADVLRQLVDARLASDDPVDRRVDASVAIG